MKDNDYYRDSEAKEDLESEYDITGDFDVAKYEKAPLPIKIIAIITLISMFLTSFISIYNAIGPIIGDGKSLDEILVTKALKSSLYEISREYNYYKKTEIMNNIKENFKDVDPQTIENYELARYLEYCQDGEAAQYY